VAKFTKETANEARKKGLVDRRANPQKWHSKRAGQPVNTGYRKGVMTHKGVLQFPQIHSCLWKWPDGTTRNYGFNIPRGYFLKQLEATPKLEVETKDHKASASSLLLCPKCDRWQAHYKCKVCGEKTITRQEKE
jgi:hypothetical protein